MSGLPTSVAGAAFLGEPGFRAVVAALEEGGDRVRAVGGAVRNTLLGETVEDVDLATTARPETVMARAAAAGLHPVPTGIEHGTVTVVAEGVPYEVTTLRADVETDGRRAVVAFTDDWAEDAGRRDFTMNAIYADADGALFDPTGGIADAMARRVRFIGTAEDRIREDYLRILRFFRFHARYGDGAPDPDGLAACVARREGLARLSRERIGMEIRKLLTARRAAETVDLMADIGILRAVLGPDVAPDAFTRATALAREGGADLNTVTAIAVLAAATPDDATDLAERLRLSRAEAEGVGEVAALSARLGASPSLEAIREAVYRAGNGVVAGALLHAAARSGQPLPEGFQDALRWTAPAFPVSGRDLLAAGMAPGPEVGRRLKAMEAAWIAAGFPPRDAMGDLLGRDH